MKAPVASSKTRLRFIFLLKLKSKLSRVLSGSWNRATKGCDLGADPRAGIDGERANLAPPVQINPGRKAINPGGLGAKPPVARCGGLRVRLKVITRVAPGKLGALQGAFRRASPASLALAGAAGSDRGSAPVRG